MADSGQIDITGNGEWLFDAAHHVQFFLWWIKVDTVEVDYRSVFPPRKTIHAGWIGLGSGIEDTAGDTLELQSLQVTWWSYTDHESNLRVNPSNFDYDDRVVYSIPPGITLTFQLFW